MEGPERSRPEAGDPNPTTAVPLRQCRLTVVRGVDRGAEVVTASDVIRVGKAGDNDLVLNEQTVSRVHFEIVRDAKGYLVRDLRSTNGTFLDGAEVREAYMRAGAVISAGAAQVRFQPVEEVIEVRPSERDSFGELRGTSARMRLAFGVGERLAPTEASILVAGEPGTGKRLFARTVHAHSRRAEGPLVLVDCAAASHALEADLFGHEKGGVPGAGAARQGAFERADRGTLVLARVDELSLDLQAKLMRVLEQRELRRMGGSRTLKVDVRVLATTTRDLRVEVEKGKFREELLARLAVATVELPPLRDRLEDVPLLVERLLAGTAGSTPPLTLDEPAVAALRSHDWPGNVAELVRVLVRSAGSEGGVERTVAPLGVPAGGGDGGGALEFAERVPFRDQKERWTDEFERRYLTWLLARAEGNVSRAARDADMDRKYLHKLLKKHGLAE